MKVTVYGPGCTRCKTSAEVVRRVLAAKGIAAEVEKVTDYAAMAMAGVMATPAVALDGRIVSSGKIPTDAEVESWLS
jgi:small redox-active disulfide protein 2